MPRFPAIEARGHALWARVVTPTSGVRHPVYQAVTAPPWLLPMPPRPGAVHTFTGSGVGRVAVTSRRRDPVHRGIDASVRRGRVGQPDGGSSSRGPASMRRDRGWRGGPGMAQRPAWVWPVDASSASRSRSSHRRTSTRRATGESTSNRWGPGHPRAPADGVVAFSVRWPARHRDDRSWGWTGDDARARRQRTSEGPRSSGPTSSAILVLGGHAVPGTLHFGVRLHGRYINPMLLLGGVPRAVLVPCCEPR